MFCGKCGNERKPGEKFCAKCGAVFPASEEKDTSAVLQKKKSKSRSGLILVGVLAAVICVSVVGIGMLITYMESDQSTKRKGVEVGKLETADTQKGDVQQETDKKQTENVPQEVSEKQEKNAQQKAGGEQAENGSQKGADKQADSALHKDANRRKDSKSKEQEVEIKKALKAYQEYADQAVDQLNFDSGDGFGGMSREELMSFDLIYLDDDEIPECVFRRIGADNGTDALLRYKDGKLYSYLSGSARVYYQKRKNRIALENSTSTYPRRHYFELEDGDGEFELVEIGCINKYGGIEELGTYKIGLSEKDVSGQEWYDYFVSFGIYWLAYSECHSLSEAYEKLLEEEAAENANDKFGIYAESVENYGMSDLEEITSCEYYFYDSGIRDFAFSYPHSLFQKAEYSEEKIKNQYGTNVQDIRFTGSSGSELRFTLTKHDGKESLENLVDSIYAKEASGLADAVKLKREVEQDYGRVIVTGYNSGRNKIIYEVVKADNEYIMQMVFTCPEYTDREDKMRKGYVTECIYRMCRFAKSGSWVRNFWEYQEAQ